MKKKLIAAAALLILLAAVLGTAVASPGDANDPFVTLNYLWDTFFPSVRDEMLAQAQQGTAQLEQDTLDELAALTDSYTAQSGGGRYAETFEALTLIRGDRLGVPPGASFRFAGGICTVEILSGSLIDVTAGTVLSSTGKLTAGHRYVAGDNTACTITAVSDAAYFHVRGSYMADLSGAFYTPFTDICSTDWFYASALYAYEENLFSGTSTTTFSPDVKMSRSMLATLLYRASGDTSPVPSAGLSDVPAGQWYTDGVNWAANHGIVSGDESGCFYPDADMTREQMCTMLYRYAKNWLRLDVSASGDLSRFPDRDKVSSYAVQAFSWATTVGLVGGTETGALNPQGTATRSQVAVILHRFNNMFS